MKNNRVCVIGARGLLGSALVRIAKEHGLDPVALDVEEIDITDALSVDRALKNADPGIVINAAAYTNVEGCEDAEGYAVAKRVNGEAIGILAKACHAIGCGFVHISTDYVFNGTSIDGVCEDEVPSESMNAYGKTKREGEERMIEACGGSNGADFVDQKLPFYLVRTSWLFGNGAKNFIGKIIALAREGKPLRVVDDEVGSPTFVDDLVERLFWLIETEQSSGIYHATGRGSCSRKVFAEAVLVGLSMKDVYIESAKLADFPRKAHIAPVSILRNTRMPDMKTWQEMVVSFADSVVV